MSIKINTDGSEDVWVELTLYQNKSLIVGSVCRYSDYNIKPIEDAFVKVIKKISVNQIIIRCGIFIQCVQKVTVHLSLSALFAGAQLLFERTVLIMTTVQCYKIFM